MGLFSGISKMLFGDPGKAIGQAKDEALGFQRQGLDYLKEIDQLPLEIRNQVLPMLSGYFMGDPSTRQEFVNRAKSDPFYAEMIQAGQEGVLAEAGPMGLTRSGNVAEDLSQSNQAVLQNLVNQRLQGLTGLATPQLNTAQVAQIYGNMGETAAGAGVAQANVEQQQIGQLLGLGTSLYGASSGSSPGGTPVNAISAPDFVNTNLGNIDPFAYGGG